MAGERHSPGNARHRPNEADASAHPGRDGGDGLRARLASIDPAVVVAALVAVHIVVWTLAPALSHPGLPLDVVEGYAIGREWVVGYHKHPAAPWWLLEASRVVTGAVGWPAYLISALSVALTYWLVFLLGRDLLGAPRALAGTLLLTGILYFSWVTPELNHNVLQMPIWVGVLLALNRARVRGGTGWWLLLGALGALGIYAKLTMGLLLAICGLYLLVDPLGRSRLATRGPWLGLAVFVLLCVPLAHWLVTTDFQVLDYAEARAARSRSGGIALFLLKQLASSVGLYVLVLAAFGTALLRSLAPARLAEAWRADRDALAFLTWLHFAPLLGAALLALATGSGLKGSWGTPMLSLSGLLVMAWAPGLSGRAPLARLCVGAALLLMLVPLAYSVVARRPEPVRNPTARLQWPQAQIAARFESLWREKTGTPLRYVASDLWAGGIVVAHAAGRLSLLVDSDLAKSPWLTLADLEKHGVLAVWWADPPRYIHDYQRLLVGGRIDGVEQFRMPARGGHYDISLPYTIYPPGSRLPDGFRAKALATEASRRTDAR